MKIIAQGAEAIIYLEKNIINKNRIPKSYRLKELDEKIRKKRTEKESKNLEKASKIINTPKIIKKTDFQLYIENIAGDKLSEKLNSYEKNKQLEILKEIGKTVAKLHENDIIHGDLTTSNIILKQDKIYIIDFGLSFISKRNEDKAVDLHLIKQALEAKHFKNHKELFENFENGYKNYKEAKMILERLKKVESRGRYKNY